MMEHIIRPEATVLPESALVPSCNLIQPPPNQFTHVVMAEQPYYFSGPEQSRPAEGQFAAGTQVVLLHHDGSAYCRVADPRGLYVSTAYHGLRRL